MNKVASYKISFFSFYSIIVISLCIILLFASRRQSNMAATQPSKKKKTKTKKKKLGQRRRRRQNVARCTQICPDEAWSFVFDKLYRKSRNRRVARSKRKALKRKRNT